MLVDFDVRGQQGMNFFTRRNIIKDNGLARNDCLELKTPQWICFL